MRQKVRTPLCEELGIEYPCSVVNDIKPAGAIVRDLSREAEAALAGPS